MSDVKIENYNEYSYLFQIVSSVINKEVITKPKTDIDIEILYRISRENKFDSYLFYALNELSDYDISEEIHQKAYCSLTNSINRATLLEKTLNEIVNLFEENGIKNIVLKGSYIKNYYPQIEFRFMVDLDILINENDLNLIDKILEKAGYKFYKSGNIEYEYISPDNVNVEFHKDLLDNTKKNYACFDDVWEKADIREGYNFSYYMDKVTYYTYITEHCLKHFFAGGFSARMILDFYIFNKYILDDKIKNEIEYKLKETKLHGFSKQLEEISNRWFAFNGEGLKYNLIDKYIVDNKSMCNKLNIVLVTAVSLENKGKKSNKFNYLLSKVFISYKNLSKYYSNLSGKPYLYPFYYILYLIKRVKQVFDKDNKFKTFDDINKLDENRKNIEDMKKIMNTFKIEEFIEYGG